MSFDVLESCPKNFLRKYKLAQEIVTRGVGLETLPRSRALPYPFFDAESKNDVRFGK
jgi:hypothetical protein